MLASLHTETHKRHMMAGTDPTSDLLKFTHFWLCHINMRSHKGSLSAFLSHRESDARQTSSLSSTVSEGKCEPQSHVRSSVGSRFSSVEVGSRAPAILDLSARAARPSPASADSDGVKPVHVKVGYLSP